jgi:hypothetical protein
LDPLCRISLNYPTKPIHIVWARVNSESEHYCSDWASRFSYYAAKRVLHME